MRIRIVLLYGSDLNMMSGAIDTASIIPLNQLHLCVADSQHRYDSDHDPYLAVNHDICTVQVKNLVSQLEADLQRREDAS